MRANKLIERGEDDEDEDEEEKRKGIERPLSSRIGRE